MNCSTTSPITWSRRGRHFFSMDSSVLKELQGFETQSVFSNFNDQTPPKTIENVTDPVVLSASMPFSATSSKHLVLSLKEFPNSIDIMEHSQSPSFGRLQSHFQISGKALLVSEAP